MPTRSSTRNTRKHENNKKRDVSEIPHKASCESLSVDINKSCHDCKPNLEGLRGLERTRKTQKNNFRNIYKRNKYEQRWSLEQHLTTNASASRYEICIETCDELSTETQVELTEEKLFHKRQFPDLKRHVTPDFNTIDKQKPSASGGTN